eukprot:TRINITY_DN2589_c0_g1_i2.p1 TRINITY_DN2589_c0_g1~~TRINITY_DN2589_c0_g1_i2.p1  ORF type:complete len:580 (-),score=190.96 TRINITY_DN2589_c0_g1_i2:16-1593(-)
MSSSASTLAPSISEEQVATPTSTTPTTTTRTSDDSATPTGDAPPLSGYQSEFLSYLGEFTMVNSAWSQVTTGYSYVKDYNPLLKSGLELAENTTVKVYNTAQPYLTQIDDKYNVSGYVDHASTVALKAAEEKAMLVKAKAEKTKEAAYKTIEVTKEKGTQIMSSANRPLNQLLDVTEILIDKILPPEIEEEPPVSDIASPKPSEEESEVDLSANPLPRAKAMTTDIAQRAKDAAIAKFHNLNLRSPQEVVEMTHVVDLIQYAATHIDTGAVKAKEFAHSTQQVVSGVVASAAVVGKDVSEKALVAGRDATTKAKERLTSLSALVDDATADVKQQSVRATVAVVAAVAQAGEIVRRRVLGGWKKADVEGQKEALETQLKEYLEKTKAYAASLSPEKLKEYVVVVNAHAAAALQNLLSIVQASSAGGLLTQLSSGLTNWSSSVRSRIETAEETVATATEKVAEKVTEKVEEGNGSTTPTPTPSGDSDTEMALSPPGTPAGAPLSWAQVVATQPHLSTEEDSAFSDSD